MLEDKYPCMKLTTDKAIHLQVHEKKSNIAESFNTDSFHMQVRYLALETTEDCLVGGRIDKLESDGPYIFIFDKDNSQAFRFLQEDGSFMNKFGKQGRGPGEYVRISNMSLNRKKKEVCLVDGYGYKLMYFDYDGQLLREEPLYYFYEDIEFIGDYMVQRTYGHGNTMAPSVNNHHLVFARQSDKAPVCVGFPYTEQFRQNFKLGMMHPFVTCNEDVYFNHLLSDTIWQIKEDGICEAKYVLKFPGRDNLFDENEFQNMTNDLYDKKTEDSSLPFYRDDIRITEDFVDLGIIKGEHMLYCIPTGHYRYGSFSQKAFASHQILRDLFTLNGKSFVKVLQPFDILNIVNSRMEGLSEEYKQYYLRDSFTEEERQLLQKMTPEDNPILMIMDIEPF